VIPRASTRSALLEERIAVPRNVTEKLFSSHSITLLLDRMGDSLHHRFHDRFGGLCRAPLWVLTSNPWPNPRPDVTSLIQDWFCRYGTWFHTHHSLPTSLRAKQLLHNRYAEPLPTQVLASAVGSNRTSLIEEFQGAFGISPAEYLVRACMRESLRRLRKRGMTVEEAARRCGYQSVGRFRTRVRRATGLTPSQIRQLEECKFDALLEDRFSLLSHTTGPSRSAPDGLTSKPPALC
jgi:AraC-like DNA-binding protein